MEHSAFINLDILSQEARKELKVFYEFLLFKYRLPNQDEKNEKNETNNEKAVKFKQFADEHLIKLPPGYKFNREEANER